MVFCAYPKRKKEPVTTYSITYDTDVVHSMTGERHPDMFWNEQSCSKRHFWEERDDNTVKVHNAHYQEVGSTYYDDGDGYYDEIQDYAWLCDYCGKVIEPGYIHSPPKPIVIKGRKHYFINNEEVSEVEYTRRLAEERIKAAPLPTEKKKCTAPWGNYPNCCNEHSDRWYNSPA